MRRAATMAVCMLLIFTSGNLFVPAWADGEYRCKGERIEKGNSTWGYARSSGSDYRIEKGSSTIGWAKKRNSKFAIESSGMRTLGWLSGQRIEKSNGATWARLDVATRMVHGCPDAVAAALWVLKQKGTF